MSVEAMTFALSPTVDRLGLAPEVRHVLLLLADVAAEDGECRPSVGYLAAKSGLSDSTVEKSLAELQSDWGLLNWPSPDSCRLVFPAPGPGPRQGERSPTLAGSADLKGAA